MINSALLVEQKGSWQSKNRVTATTPELDFSVTKDGGEGRGNQFPLQGSAGELWRLDDEVFLEIIAVNLVFGINSGIKLRVESCVFFLDSGSGLGAERAQAEPVVILLNADQGVLAIKLFGQEDFKAVSPVAELTIAAIYQGVVDLEPAAILQVMNGLELDFSGLGEIRVEEDFGIAGALSKQLLARAFAPVPAINGGCGGGLECPGRRQTERG